MTKPLNKSIAKQLINRLKPYVFEKSRRACVVLAALPYLIFIRRAQRCGVYGLCGSFGLELTNKLLINKPSNNQNKLSSGEGGGRDLLGV